MKSRLRTSLLITVIGLLITLGSCILFKEWIIHNVVRRSAEQQIGSILSAQVTIDRLIFRSNQLTVKKLALQTTTGVTLSISQIEGKFTLASLLKLRLEALHITAPHLDLTLEDAPAEYTSLPFPKRPLLTIDKITIRHGQATIHRNEQPLIVHEINSQGSFAANSPFTISAFVGPGDSDPLMLRGQVNWQQTLALSLHELRWRHQSLIKAPLTLELIAGGVVKGGGSVRIESLNDQMLSELVSALDTESPLPKNIGFNISDSVLKIALLSKGPLVEINIDSGHVSYDDHVIPFSQLSLNLNQHDNIWQGRGQLIGPAETTIDIETQFTAKTLSGKSVIKVPACDLLLQQLSTNKPPGIFGQLKIDSDFNWQQDKFVINSHIQGQKGPVNKESNLINIAAVTGTFNWQQTPTQQQFNLRLQLAEIPTLSVSGNAQQMEYSLNIANRQQLAKLINPTMLPAALEQFNNVKMTGVIQYSSNDRWHGDLRLTARQLAIASTSTTDLKLSSQLRQSKNKLMLANGKLKASIAKGDELTAQLSADFSAQRNQQNTTLQLKQFKLTHIDYFSPEGDNGLAGGEIELHGQIAHPHSSQQVALKLSGKLTANEVLAGSFYADLAALHGQFTLNSDLALESSTLKSHSLLIKVPAIGEIRGSGLFSPQLLTFSGNLKLPDLDQSYRQHLGPLLVEMYPPLAGLTLAGKLAANIDLHWTPKTAQLFGDLQLGTLNVSSPTWKLDIINGSGQLPFALTSGETPPTTPATIQRRGKVSFDSVTAGVASLTPGKLLLTADNNRFKLDSPLLFQLADGLIKIDDLSVDVSKPTPQGSVVISAANIDLETLTRKLELPIMQGTISADLGEIRYVDQQLSTKGQAQIDVFDGRFMISNIRLRAPFSPYPILNADVDFTGLNLYKATRTFEFGEMNGIVDGYIHDLRLFGTTPSTFKAQLKSRRTGKRNISVKALNNLSILSQGGISAALSKGVYQFIDFYRYKKIGIFCELDNDLFILKGTALRDSDNYLVYGGLLPPRIDIKTSVPTISFKEMVRRLNRIERAGN